MVCSRVLRLRESRGRGREKLIYALAYVPNSRNEHSDFILYSFPQLYRYSSLLSSLISFSSRYIIDGADQNHRNRLLSQKITPSYGRCKAKTKKQ